MSDFHKQITAAANERRLSTGDFIAFLASGAAHINKPVQAVDTKSFVSAPVKQHAANSDDWHRSVAKTNAVITQFLDGAAAATAAGHVFDMGSIIALRGLIEPAFDAFVAGRLVVPYSSPDGTLFVIRTRVEDIESDGVEDTRGEIPFAILITADETGVPSSFTSFVLAVDDGVLSFQPVSCSIQHGDPERPARARVLPTAFRPDGSMDVEELERCRHVAFFLGLAALLAVNDDRLAFRRDVPAPALNKARMKSGKPPLPGVWRMPPPAVVSNYVTKLGIRGQEPKTSKGGTHASPIQHERRGHLRRLASGRITKVRSTLVGGLDKHLNPERVRAFYEVNA
jgi:hypothetical protein